MLVLSRTSGEEIIIDGNVRVKVVEVRGNRVRLAVCAPKDVPIRRSELEVEFGIGRCPEDEIEEFSTVIVGG
jgi:carbon storage regulator